MVLESDQRAVDERTHAGHRSPSRSFSTIRFDGPKRSSDLPEQLKWDPLQATAQEGDTVKALTGGSLLVQQQATAEAVKSIPAPKILHLATHAFYLPNQPQQQLEIGGGLLDQRGSRGVVQNKSLQGESPLLRSGIALAGANQPNADSQMTAISQSWRWRN